MARASGWYTLPSGTVIHLQADKEPDQKALELMDLVAERATRMAAVMRLRGALHALATGAKTYKPNGIMRRPNARRTE